MAINIRDLDRARVLVALHEAARPGALQGGYKNVPPIRITEANALLAERESFAYIEGRAMFVTFEGDLVHVHDYDHHNGRGCAESAIAPLLAEALGCGKVATTEEDRAVVRELLAEARPR